jgi:hypothetical protein
MIKSMRMRWAGHVALTKETRSAYRVLVGKPEGKRLRGRRRCRWEGNVKIHLRVIEWCGTELIDLVQGMDH